MTLTEALEGRSLKMTRLLERGSLLLVPLAAILMLALHRHNNGAVSVFLALVALILPAAYLLSRRRVEKMRQRETEARLEIHTRSFLERQEPVRPRNLTEDESDAEILARAIDWRSELPRGFQKFNGIASVLPVGEPTVFDALPRRYAVRNLYERRFADPAKALPKPVFLPFSELSPAAVSRRAALPVATPASAIEYANGVMEEIRMRAAAGYQRIRHGGVEVGGVLFGSRQDGMLRIVAARPLECEYLNGPRFVLSARDEAALAVILLAAGDDPELDGLEPVGFYHSNTREEIKLSDADMRLFDRFFPNPGQVALLVRPAHLAATRARFFRRGADGMVRADVSYGEFEMVA